MRQSNARLQQDRPSNGSFEDKDQRLNRWNNKIIGRSRALLEGGYLRLRGELASGLD